MILLDLSYDELVGLFTAAIFTVIILHEWISGEIPGSLFGGWVTRREKNPIGFQRSILSGIALVLFLLVRVALHHWWRK